MSNEQRKEVPEAVRKIVNAMVNQALAKCERLGIARADFLQAFLELQRRNPTIALSELLERTFRQLRGAAN